jgi:hypothetical protein
MINWAMKAMNRLISFLKDLLVKTARMLIGWGAIALGQGVATGLVGISTSVLGAAKDHAKEVGASMSISSPVNVFSTGSSSTSVSKRQETPGYMAAFV